MGVTNTNCEFLGSGDSKLQKRYPLWTLASLLPSGLVTAKNWSEGEEGNADRGRSSVGTLIVNGSIVGLGRDQRLDLLWALDAPDDRVPGQPANKREARQEGIERAQRHPPPETLGTFPQNPFPVAVLIGVNAVNQVILHEKQQC